MRKLLKIVAVILVIAVLAIIILPFVIPVDALKGQVLTRIEAATGRKVAIEKISLSVFPDIALAADDVSISNPAWAGAGNMAEIKQLRLGVELMPLLHEQVNIKELTLDSPVITLIKNGNQSNWQFTQKVAENKAAAADAQAKQGNKPETMNIIPSHITIKNGSVTYEDTMAGTHRVTDINLNLKAPHPSEKADFDFKADVDGKKADITIEISNPLTVMEGKPSDIDAKIAYDTIKLSWVGTLALVDNKPVITGKITLPTVDVASSSKAPGKAGSSGEAAPAKAGHWSDAPIDMSGLNSADVDATVAIGKLVLPKTTLTDIALAIRLSRGALTLKTNDIALYDGTATVALGAASTGGINATTTINHVNVASLLHDFANNDKLSGMLDADVKVTSQGKSQRALVSALDGNGKFALKNGKLKGVDIAGMLRNITSANLSGGSESTDFSDVAGTFTLQNGVISNNDLKMNSPLLRVTGAGTADLPNWRVEYLLQPKFVASMQGQGGKDAGGITIPIRVEGALDNPSYRPDAQAALKANLQDPAKLKDTVNQLKDSLGKGNLKNNLQNILR